MNNPLNRFTALAICLLMIIAVPVVLASCGSETAETQPTASSSPLLPMSTPVPPTSTPFT